MTSTRPGPDGKPRCVWCLATPEYVAYHDESWGFPVADDRALFEMLSLEAFQSGLSWLTVLRKREGFRRAFAEFDPARIAAFGAEDVTRLLADPGIIRHRGKIEAVIHNARLLPELQAREGSFAAWVWRHEPASSAEALEVARAMAKDLKKRGWKFTGPTVLHSFLQAAGLVNDHAEGCATHAASHAARAAFARPV